MIGTITSYIYPSRRYGDGSSAASYGQGGKSRAVEERLKETEDLLAARSAELSGAHAFLSTTDRVSEDDVLGIVRDLNENIYQVAVRLTEEWRKLDPLQAATRTDVGPTPQRVPFLFQLVRSRDPAGLTFSLQSCLCCRVVDMTLSWGHHRELAILESIYQRLSVSEGQAVSARWRSLTHTYLSRPPPRPELLVEGLASILDNTGSFSNPQQSLDFVRDMALEGIESIVRLAQRSELAFMVEVKSSDMSLLFEAPGVTFDSARMTSEHGPGGILGERGRIAGTTEVGVRKSMCGGRGESPHTEILLKTKVVLERDVVGAPSASGKVRSSALLDGRGVPYQSGQASWPLSPRVNPPGPWSAVIGLPVMEGQSPV